MAYQGDTPNISQDAEPTGNDGFCLFVFCNHYSCQNM